MIFDLHVHTTHSDGLLTPKETIDLAKAKGIDGIAITDHDTVSAIEPAVQYSQKEGLISVIPGIEFGCIYRDEEVHILGYFIDYKSEDFLKIIRELKVKRINRGVSIIDKINEIGMKLTIDEVENFCNKDYIGRPHIARAMVQRGYADNVGDAFNRYLKKGMPAYVRKDTFTLKELIKIVHKFNGIAILAHPGLLYDRTIIFDCIKYGIDGIEVIHSKHNMKDVESFKDISRKYKLIETGGSDCHGYKIDGEYILGNYNINLDYIPLMKGRL